MLRALKCSTVQAVRCTNFKSTPLMCPKLLKGLRYLYIGLAGNCQSSSHLVLYIYALKVVDQKQRETIFPVKTKVSRSLIMNYKKVLLYVS